MSSFNMIFICVICYILGMGGYGVLQYAFSKCKYKKVLGKILPVLCGVCAIGCLIVAAFGTVFDSTEMVKIGAVLFIAYLIYCIEFIVILKRVN